MTAAMTRREAAEGFPLLPAGSTVGIVAGGGALPLEIAKALANRECRPFVVLIEGEADPGSPLETFPHEILPLEDIGRLIGMLKRHGVTHLVLAGEIRRRPRLSAMRLTPGLLGWISTAVVGYAKGDDGLLRRIVRRFESKGIRIVGAHEIVPELLAVEGVWGKASPRAADRRDLEAARAAAEAIGALDIGQGAVAVGGRAIALEGIEGTNGLLERVAELRGHGRLAGKTGGVLVKCAKPGQELRTDLPTVGPRTVELAHAAGLAGIGVEAGRSLVMEGPAMIGRADALGLFVMGLPTRNER